MNGTAKPCSLIGYGAHLSFSGVSTNRLKASAPFARHHACLLVGLVRILAVVALTAATTTQAQIDPEARQILHLGFTQSLRDDGPDARYLFYYWNMPDVPSTNQVLRLILAPTYLDGELGFKGLLGENTDLGLNVFGGGYEYNYDEVRGGN